MLTRDKVLETLRAHEKELRQRGVMHAALFGSLARGEADEESDIDIGVEIDPETRKIQGVYEYVGLQLHIQDMFPGRVDVVNLQTLKPGIRESVAADLTYAF